MSGDSKPLFVRLPAADADRLTAAAARSGVSKRHLVGAAVRRQLEEADGLVVGRVSLREAPPEVLTAEEAAALLRVDAAAVVESAERGDLPGRQVGGHWRFAHDAVLDWLAHAA
jgi:excisionase family DNA binding protein